MFGGWPDDDLILTLWRARKNTAEIAKHTWVHESQIASRLPGILLRARQDDEFDQQGRSDEQH